MVYKEGRLVTVHEVEERGLACNCICPACGSKLQAHKGNVKQPYFSHYRGDDCGCGLETAVHLLAKEIIEKEKKVLLPELIAEPDWSKLRYIEREYRNVDYSKEKIRETIVKSWKEVYPDSVELEKK